jgi:TatD DNase family protein
VSDKKYKYIDIHAHVNFPEYDADREQVIRAADDDGILMINVGTDLETSRAVVEIANKYPNCYAIVGLHPTHTNDDGVTVEFDYEGFKKLARDQRVVGIGECGLDYFRIKKEDEKAIGIQKNVFRRQIELAIEVDKPLMIHARDSYREILTILDEYLIQPGVKLRGNIHFFAGNLEEARAFLERGFTLSFTGVITFAKQYRELVEFVPLDMVMSETDCPFVTPVPFRGQRNEPKYVTYVVEKMAQIKGISADLMADHLMQNAKRVFGV